MYQFQTKIGLFSIVNYADRWHIIFRNERYDNYSTPEQAIDDLAGGHTYSLPDGIDSSTLEISDNLSDWTFIKNS